MQSSFQDLMVWKKAHECVLKVYRLTKSFPKEELFGITSQLRRAIVSVPNNIAEGKGRETDPDFRKFLIYSRGSLEESKYLILLSKDLSYVTSVDYEECTEMLNEIGKMLNSLIVYLGKKEK